MATAAASFPTATAAATSTMSCNGRWASSCFLLIDDPWRVFFTTDHPNGAPFTAYPELFALLMDRQARNECHSRAAQAGVGDDRPAVDRARIHADRDRHHDAGSAGPPARPCRPRPSWPRRPRRHRGLSPPRRQGGDVPGMPPSPSRAGTIVVRDGKVVATPDGRALVVRPAPAPPCRGGWRTITRRRSACRRRFFHVDAAALGRRDPFMEVACRS